MIKKKSKLQEKNKIKSEKKPIKSSRLTKKTALFIRDHDGIFIVSQEFLKDLTFEESVALGLSTLIELRSLMVGDAITNGETCIQNIQVVTGFNNTLNQLELNYPAILKHIHGIEPQYSSIKIFSC